MTHTLNKGALGDLKGHFLGKTWNLGPAWGMESIPAGSIAPEGVWPIFFVGRPLSGLLMANPDAFLV